MTGHLSPWADEPSPGSTIRVLGRPYAVREARRDEAGEVQGCVFREEGSLNPPDYQWGAAWLDEAGRLQYRSGYSLREARDIVDNQLAIRFLLRPPQPSQEPDMSSFDREQALADEQRVALTLAGMVRRAHRNSYDKGWWDAQKRDAIDRKVLDGEAKLGDLDPEQVRATIPEKLMLIVTEVAEAMEAYRDPEHGVTEAWTGEGGKPEGLAAELANVVIRIGDLCGALGIDLEAAVLAKMAHNERRPHRHGGKRA